MRLLIHNRQNNLDIAGVEFRLSKKKNDAVMNSCLWLPPPPAAPPPDPSPVSPPVSPAPAPVVALPPVTLGALPSQ